MKHCGNLGKHIRLRFATCKNGFGTQFSSSSLKCCRKRIGEKKDAGGTCYLYVGASSTNAAAAAVAAASTAAKRFYFARLGCAPGKRVCCKLTVKASDKRRVFFVYLSSPAHQLYTAIFQYFTK